MSPGQRLTFTASPVVAERLGALGRTEDVLFSPDQTRLAIAGFNANRILVIEIGIVAEDGVITLRSDRCVELRCQDFQRPHGLAWLDDATLVIGNRKKGVVIVPVPAASDAGQPVDVHPLLQLCEEDDGLIMSPGSVAITQLTDSYFDLLVCNNYRNYVSRHMIRRTNGFEVISALRLFEHDLKVPDGIAISDYGDLVAISNHDGKRVDVFPNDAASGRQSLPLCSLGVSDYPHGIRFAMDDRLVLVADAGAPFVHVFARDGATWTDAAGPRVSIKVMDDDAFRRGRANPREGGPKGLDVLRDGSLFVVSCEEVPIAFFDFRSMRDQLLGTGTATFRPPRSGDGRLLDTVVATVKGQQDQIRVLRAELDRLTPKKAKRTASIDSRLIRALERLAERLSGKS